MLKDQYIVSFVVVIDTKHLHTSVLKPTHMHTHIQALFFTHMKIALSLIKSSTAERFPNTMLMIRKKNAPLLLLRQGGTETYLKVIDSSDS